MFVVLVEESNDDTEEVLNQNVFGPFSDHATAGDFGEKKIQDYEGDYSIGWSVVLLQKPE